MTGKKENVVLQVKNLAAGWQQRPIINQVNFTVRAGECVGIIGPNGAGKSTLLKALRGLIPLLDGSVHYFNKPLTEFAEKELARHVAYMQQDVNVSFGFTGLAVVLAGRYSYLSWWQGETEEDYRIARSCMECTGVLDLADVPVQQVSGGQRQRVLLAKALAQATPLLFLDEPTASLDLLYQEEIFRYCQTMSESGKTILMVVHDLKLAAKFCSRLLLVADGGILADGAPDEVITGENLAKAYGLQSAVFTNRVTGTLDIHTFAESEREQRQSVHVLGGGGAAAGWLRELYEQGYNVTTGILQQGDTDAETAAAFGIACIMQPPFAEPEAALIATMGKQVAGADITILANIYYGKLNLACLQAAFAAKRLLIVEDTPIEERDYSGGAAKTLYQELCRKEGVTVMSSNQLNERLRQGEL